LSEHYFLLFEAVGNIQVSIDCDHRDLSRNQPTEQCMESIIDTLFSPSLSLTHTHTNTHTLQEDKEEKADAAWEAKMLTRWGDLVRKVLTRQRLKVQYGH
jgi:hypothetical protein